MQINKYELTEEQRQLLLKEWDAKPEAPPSLLSLMNALFPGQELDGRTKEGKAVKEFLASQNIKARCSHEYQTKEKINISEEDKTFIENNFQLMSSVEIARVIFKNNKLTNLNQESRAVNDFIKTLDQSESFEDTEELPEEEYRPPKTFDKTLCRVNKYTNNSISKNKITGQVRKNIETLIDYLNTYRFIYQINTYTNTTDRKLFESSFVRYANDKPDLSQEEVDQYIVLSSEVVIAANIQRRKEHLTGLLDNIAEDKDGRISMSLVEAIGKTETEYNQSVNRQQKLLSDLKEKRSDKLKKETRENASILNLIRVWKEEEGRVKLLKLAELRKKSIQEEVKNLSDMDEVKARILGINEDEI